MSTHLQTTRYRVPATAPGAIRDRPEGAAWSDRLIQAALALYLIPALLVVLVAGGLGVVILAAARLLTGAQGGTVGGPRAPVGPESISSRR
jgi:hypothetical protein